MRKIALFTVLMMGCVLQTPYNVYAQRKIHYAPQGKDFIRISGERKFNRALYGTNTGFRVETGDLPEFALYMLGMGGNLRLFLVTPQGTKPITEAESIKTVYSPGSMNYTLTDSWLKAGILRIKVMAMANAEGILVQLNGENLPENLQLAWVFGGATGKKFSRDGDIGADPESSFYLKRENCADNVYTLSGNGFKLYYGGGKPHDLAAYQQLIADKKAKTLSGIFPGRVTITDANAVPGAFHNASSSSPTAPVAWGSVSFQQEKKQYLCVYHPEEGRVLTYQQLAAAFSESEKSAAALASRVELETPDPYINTLGGALSMAADAIWENPTFLHGAVAWRMRLNAWRGASVADPLGWHDRAQTHFSSYAKSQVISPETGPVVADTLLHLARQQEKIGNSMFSSGYICRNPNGDIRPHHYDMNLVFIDQLLTHFNWTGDTAYVKEMWPVIQKHLAWEKRNFDADNDGLYDAYCCIWASDALQYSAGGVTHSSAYNYRAFKAAGELAHLAGENGAAYTAEANKIKAAVNKHLWLPEKGWFAEYIDKMGHQLVHPAAGLWTIYHAMESGLPNAFQAWQSLQYIDEHIPHLPFSAEGLNEQDLFLLSTTNWQPYTWSINNVALAELLHTSLAYWQGGRNEKAYRIWRNALIESMYLGASPGGFQQLSYYDEIRGELYRDFADPIGMAARSLVEGLFGIQPNALKDSLLIQPGFPTQWNHARLKLPHLGITYKQEKQKDIYSIQQQRSKSLHLELQLRARGTTVREILVNGKKTNAYSIKEGATHPTLVIRVPKSSHNKIEVTWGNETPVSLPEYSLLKEEKPAPQFHSAQIIQVYDPQQSMQNGSFPKAGKYTIFYLLKQGIFTWWQPSYFTVLEPLEILVNEVSQQGVRFTIKNNTANKTIVSAGIRTQEKNALRHPIEISGHAVSKEINVPASQLDPGTNLIYVSDAEENVLAEKEAIYWNISTPQTYRPVPISSFFNDKVHNIFRNQYLSPRPAVPTLQLPTQGIGNWCYPLVEAVISDSGIRAQAGFAQEIKLQNGLVFQTPSGEGDNIAYTSMWDNYPRNITLPLSGNASHAYFLMAGSTNHMQSQFINGTLKITYTDNSFSLLELKNPETWWPIEQDYLNTGKALSLKQTAPIRISLKTGKQLPSNYSYQSIKGFSNRVIDGGAATVLDLVLDPTKTLKSLTVETLANDVVIGLMSITLAK